MNRKVDTKNLLNWWLEKYHNTNYDKVLEDNPEWLIKPEEHTREFYDKYQVTQEQHDEWEKWAKEYTKKVTGIKGKMFDRSWGFVYLDTAPNVKQ